MIRMPLKSEAGSARVFVAVGIALVGLGALKGVSTAAGFERFLALETAAVAAEPAPAKAETEAKPEEADAHDGPASEHADASAAEPATSSGAPSSGCACGPPTLADRAGLSQTEIEVLSRLSERRRTIEAKEVSLAEQESLLAAAEGRIASRIEELKTLESRIEGLLGQLDEAEAAEVARLVSIYEKMKPDSAADIFAQMDEETLVKVTARMRDTMLSAILAKMAPEHAVRLTMLLAQRHIPPDTLGEADQTAADAAR